MLQQIYDTCNLSTGFWWCYEILFINPPAVQKSQDFSINYVRLLQIYLMVFWDSILTALRVEDAEHFAGFPESADFKESEKLINYCSPSLVQIVLK